MPLDADPIALRRTIIEALPADARAAVGRLVSAAAPARVYCVGGAVRDAILRRAIVDIDLTIEGDAIDATRAAFPSARITTHARFCTATLAVGGVRIDIATARSETYARPGALPKVAASDIGEDLRRRDFAINALALPLDGSAALLDPCGGIDDLCAGRVRVLHDRSFDDDATRIFRAFRYAARLGFEIEPHTRGLIDTGVDCIAAIGGERLRNELELIFADENAATCLRACDAAGALHAIHPALTWPKDAGIPNRSASKRNRDDSAASASPSGGRARGEVFGFAVLTAHASASEAGEIIARLKLKRAAAAAVIAMPALRALAPALARTQAKPSGITVLLDRYPAPAIEAFAAVEAESIAGQVARRYLAEWRATKPALNGRELAGMGVPEGPRIQQALQLLRAARLDGWAVDRDDERVLAARFVKSITDSAAMSPIELHTHGR